MEDECNAPSRTGNLFVISGPSGAGKGTLVAEMMKRIPDAWLSVSATTRQPRPGETDGTSYYFVDDEEFDRMRDNGGLLEWAEVHGHRYGTPRDKVVEKVGEGRQVILEIDPRGAYQIRRKLPGAVLIFIMPPSLEVLEQRLRDRKTEDEGEIERRMADAREWLKLAGTYDHCVVNDRIEDAVNELVGIVDGYAGA